MLNNFIFLKKNIFLNKDKILKHYKTCFFICFLNMKEKEKIELLTQTEKFVGKGKIRYKKKSKNKSKSEGILFGNTI